MAELAGDCAYFKRQLDMEAQIKRLLEEKVGLAVRRPSGPAKERTLAELGRRLDVSEAEMGSLQSQMDAATAAPRQPTMLHQTSAAQATPLLRPLQEKTTPGETSTALATTEKMSGPGTVAEPTSMSVAQPNAKPQKKKTLRGKISSQIGQFIKTSRKCQADLKKHLKGPSPTEALALALRDKIAEAEGEIARLKVERNKLSPLEQSANQPGGVRGKAKRGTRGSGKGGAPATGANTEPLTEMEPPWKRARIASPERPSGSVAAPPPPVVAPRGDTMRPAEANDALRRLREARAAKAQSGPAPAFPVHWADSGLAQDILHGLDGSADFDDGVMGWLGPPPDANIPDYKGGASTALGQEMAAPPLSVKEETIEGTDAPIKSEPANSAEDSYPNFL